MKKTYKLSLFLFLIFSAVLALTGCGKKVTAPTQVTSFLAQAGNGQVSLTWQAPESDGGSSITEFQLTMDNWESIITKQADEFSHTFTQLNNGTKYTFKIKAKNSKGLSP